MPAQAQLDPGSPCGSAIAAQEGLGGLPPGLLGAIARVESQGRPWAFNAAGASHFAASREDAVARVRALLQRGVRNLDVGCMQISLAHHPGAFRSLEEAFEPTRNVAYAARFLTELRARHGSWPAAIAHYHSGTPERGQEYLRRVQMVWSESPGAAPRPAPQMDRVTVLASPEANLVQVIRPSLPVQAGRGPVARPPQGVAQTRDVNPAP